MDKLVHTGAVDGLTSRLRTLSFNADVRTHVFLQVPHESSSRHERARAWEAA